MKRKILVFSLLMAAVLLISTGLAQAQAGKKAVFIIASENFQDDEFAQPLAIFEKNGISVTVASTTTEEVTGMDGLKTTPDVLLNTIQAEDYDAVVFIGGSGAAQYIDDPLAHQLAQDALEQNKILGAICLAPRILGKAGVLTGKNATVYPTEGEKLAASGVNYTAKPVEQDGNIVTADGPGSATAFGAALVELLK